MSDHTQKIAYAKCNQVGFVGFLLNVAAFMSASGGEFYKKIDKSTLQRMAVGKDVQLVDVRTPQEYQNGYIDDAINFDVSDDAKFLGQISRLNKEEPIYIYCKMGGRSNRAAELMKELGFRKIYDYTGGFNDWNATD